MDPLPVEVPIIIDPKPPGMLVEELGTWWLLHSNKHKSHLLFLLVESAKRLWNSSIHRLRGAARLPVMLNTDVVMLGSDKLDHLAVQTPAGSWSMLGSSTLRSVVLRKLRPK